MDDPLARRGGLEALEVAVGEKGALGGGHGWPRKNRRCRSGLRGGYGGGMSIHVLRCRPKCIKTPCWRALSTKKCCLLLHAVLAPDVYNREVIPRWKERFGGASATGA